MRQTRALMALAKSALTDMMEITLKTVRASAEQALTAYPMQKT